MGEAACVTDRSEDRGRGKSLQEPARPECETPHLLDGGRTQKEHLTVVRRRVRGVPCA